MTKAVFIDGEAGTTGLGIRERLAGVADVRVISIDPTRRKDPEARRAMMIEADLVVLCLPDAAAKESAALAQSLGDRAPKLLDASTAHRVDPAWPPARRHASLPRPASATPAATPRGPSRCCAR
jgi:N-acetyl-gamma-glutamyl-phosphate reductase